MKNTNHIDMRKYLLGLHDSESEREDMELRLLRQPTLLDELLVVEDDLIEDYVDGSLSPEEVEAFESNFLLTSERRGKFRFAKIADRHLHLIRGSPIREKAISPGFFNFLFAWFQAGRYRPLAAAALLMAAMLGAFYFVYRSDDGEAGLASLNRAFERERPLDARISGFDYAPKTTLRGSDTPNIDVTARNLAERIILDDAARSETAKNLHSLGRLYLVKKDFSEAENSLERALAASPDDPEILNDRGIALLEIGRQASEAEGGKRLESFARALEDFQRAIDLKKDFTPALFNKAVTLGEMNLPAREAQAWRDYLQIDGESPWAAEARRRLEAAEAPSPMAMTVEELTSEFLAAYRARNEDKAFELVSGNREMITGKLIPQRLAFLFVDSESGGAEAAEYLAAMKFVGDLELKRTGDTSWQKMAEYYASFGYERKARLKEAQDKIRTGYERCLLNRYSEALPLFTDAARMFSSIDDGFEADIANYWVSYTLDRTARYSESREVLKKVAERSRAKGYVWLESRAVGWLAMIKIITENDFSDLSMASEGFRLAKISHDVYGLQKISEVISVIHRRVGDYEAALDFGSRGVSAAAFSGGSMREHWRGLSNLSELFFILGYYAASEEIMQEALKLTRSGLNEKTFEYMALLRLGQIAVRRGSENAMQDYFLHSRAVASQFEESERLKLTAYLDLSAGNAFRDVGDCGRAVEFYQAAAAFYDRAGDPVERYDVQKGMLICGIERKDEVRVQEIAPKVLEMLDTHRQEIADEAGRNGFFGNEQEVYDALIEYEAGRGDIAKAFEYSEISRSRSLLAMMSAAEVKRNGHAAAKSESSASPAGIEAVRQSMPANVQIVQYAVLGNSVYCWTISRSGAKTVSMPVSRNKLREKVAAYIAAISKPSGTRVNESKRLAAELSSLIFEPIRQYLDPKSLVVIVPDKMLSGLPFAAMLSPQSGRYLVEDFELQYASSSATFLLATAMASRMPRQDRGENLLAIGDPSFNSALFPDLASLNSARREADSIAENYRRRTVLTGAEATKSKVGSAISDAEVFHFAGHYVYDERTPNLSGFVLADEDSALDLAAVLRNSEISRLEFPRLKLVVLSACRTGAEKIIDGEGMLGAARAFLAKGIPLVVASHWEVDSAATANLMTRFHRLRTSEGIDSATALRKAQLELLNGGDAQLRDPYFWAAFIALGGHAAF